MQPSISICVGCTTSITSWVLCRVGLWAWENGHGQVPQGNEHVMGQWLYANAMEKMVIDNDHFSVAMSQ